MCALSILSGVCYYICQCVINICPCVINICPCVINISLAENQLVLCPLTSVLCKTHLKLQMSLLNSGDRTNRFGNTDLTHLKDENKTTFTAV